MKIPLPGLCIVSSLAVVPASAADGIGPVLADGQKIVVSGNEHKRSFPCNGRHLVVEGTDHVVTTTGVCASAEISGAGNTVTVEIAPKGKLVVAGTDNKIQWKSTGNPVQDFSGVDNWIQKIK